MRNNARTCRFELAIWNACIVSVRVVCANESWPVTRIHYHTHSCVAEIRNHCAVAVRPKSLFSAKESGSFEEDLCRSELILWIECFYSKQRTATIYPQFVQSAEFE